MNDKPTGQQAELTADVAVDAVETIVWRYANAEEITRGMLRDANEGVEALRELVQACEECERIDDLLPCTVDQMPDPVDYIKRRDAAYQRRKAALAACRAVGGAR
jgi:hypothetical protein